MYCLRAQFGIKPYSLLVIISEFSSDKSTEQQADRAEQNSQLGNDGEAKSKKAGDKKESGKETV